MISMPCVIEELTKLLSRQVNNWELFLIDDGSTDGSREWITRYIKGKGHIRVVFHKKNEGIAKTYRQLYREAKGDIVVLFSLDGEWDPHDVIRLIDAVKEEHEDMVIGVRRHKKYTVWRAVVSSIYNTSTRVVFGIDTRDAGSIKAMRRTLVLNIPIVSRGVFDEAERIIRAKRQGYRIGFIDVAHTKSIKMKRGIHPFHVFEACVDMLRVFFAAH